MKYKARLKRLEARQKYWDSYGRANKESGHLHVRPGSQTK